MACSIVLVSCVVAAMGSSLNWPLVGDASLMHYAVFLQHQGLAPYRDIVDINLPGSYAFEAIGMRCLGPNALGWRLYDSALLILLLLAAIALAGRRNWFAGLFSGSLFALVHLQDGLEQGGQRNLVMAVLLLWSYVALFRWSGSKSGDRWILLAGLGLGCSVTIKPTTLPLALALIGGAAWLSRRTGRSPFRTFGAGMLGLVLPSALALAWLQQLHALPAFVQMCRDLLPLHALLGRQRLSFLLSHCLSPISALAALWLAVCFFDRPRFSLERVALMVGVLGCGLAYVAEEKGFSYQRYPLLAVLLCLIGLDVTAALLHKGAPRTAAVCACILGCFAMAPRYAWMVHTFQPDTPFESTLSADLLQLSGQHGLNRQVQCLDTFGGCINTLYDLRIRESTGFLYDCYLFSGNSNVNEQYRQAFWNAFQSNRPRIVVETNNFCFGDARGFDKIALWPELESELARTYVLHTAWRSPALQHWWNRRERPTEFRIYLRREEGH